MRDADVVAQASLVASGALVEIFQHGIHVEPAFLPLAERGYRALETLLGRRLDTATLGPKIQIYVSDAVPVSHVWRGYEHPTDPKGIVFLNARAYQEAMRGTNATYVHEMAHLFTWRYRSHTLREGLADYLALKIHPGAGVGPNPDGHDEATKVPTRITEYLGTRKPAPDWLTADAYHRRVYYLASYRFVKHLIERKNLETFMTLYEADDPEAAMPTLYGATREELVRLAGM